MAGVASSLSSPGENKKDLYYRYLQAECVISVLRRIKIVLGLNSLYSSIKTPRRVDEPWHLQMELELSPSEHFP
jgi:hypothetical protein